VTPAAGYVVLMISIRAMPVRRRAQVAALLGAAGLVALGGCGGDDGDGGEQSPPTAGPSPTGDGDCAWAVQVDATTQNVAYPDTNATYWTMSYALAAGEELELAGTYAAARYSSFISYGPVGGPIDVLTDRDIEPDEGSSNPFADVTGDVTGHGRGGEADGTRRYTVRITRDEPQTAAGEAPNVLAARRGDVAPEASGGAPAPTLPEGTETPEPPVLLGSGAGDPDAVAGTVLYRVYLSDDADDPAGGPLPEVTLVTEGGERTPVPTCDSPGPSEIARELAANNGPPTDREAPPQPVFVRPEASALNLFPNPDNVYIATIAAHRPGVVVVLQGRAPTFPDPAAGRPVGGDEQVRYWSLCTDEYRKPYPVSSCVADRDVVLDADGRYTFVISTAEDRPANATAADGVTWLDWGSTEVDNLLLMRHMLADPGFDESAIDVAPGALASSSMGAYAPEGRYCTVEAFEADGPQCPAA
jgi:hypothetical protein